MKKPGVPKWIMLWTAVVLVFSACRPVPPRSDPTPAPPDRVLFYGDGLTSYNLGLSEHVERLAASADPPQTLTTRAFTAGTVRLIDHAESSRFNAVRERDWDVVVLQEDSHWAAREEFFQAVRRFNAEIEAAGAETVLLMTWERDTVKQFLTTEEIAETHRQIADELDLKVAPAGLAWKRAATARPDLELYAPDRHHPSARGTYLTACVLYAVIYGRSPEGLPYQPADMIADVESLEYMWEQWSMSEDELVFLQKTAWDTVRDYQAQPD